MTYISSLILAVIGNIASKAMEMGIDKVAFHAPPSNTLEYSNINPICYCLMKDEPDTKIAMCMFEPKNEKDKTLCKFTKLDTVIIYSHGNSEDIFSISYDCQRMATELNQFILCYDYVGYGKSSPGVTTEVNLHSAIESVYDYAKGHLKAKNVILMGRSIGTAPTIYLSSMPDKYSHNGVILLSPLASGVRTLTISHYLPEKVVSNLDKIFMPSLEYIKKTKVPILLIHGQQDKVVAVDNTHDLYKNIPSKQKTLPVLLGTRQHPVGHNDLLSKEFQIVASKIDNFIKSSCELKP